MKALLFITKQNMKKKKGDVIVLFLLTALAALLFYTSVSVFSGMNTVLDQAYEKAHTADFLYITQGSAEKVKGVLTAQEEVAEYEASDCIYLAMEYKKDGETEWSKSQFVFGKIEEERTIGKLAGSENAEISYDSMLLPYYLKASGGYKEGDICTFKLGEEEYQFQIAGFVEDPLFATSLNISIYSAYISSDFMEDLLKENETVQSAQYVKHMVRLEEGEDSVSFEEKITPVLVSEVPEVADSMSLGMNWGTMKGGVTMMSNISMGILLVFSVLLILVALIIIRFSIRNYIEMNLKNMGILQAAGYTAKQLRFTVLIEMTIISAVAALAGISLGVAGSSLIGSFEGIMLGLSWGQIFNPSAAVITAIVIPGMVLIVSFISSGIYKKFAVLESLRGGIRTHNYKKNYFGFDKNSLPVSFVLAGKNLMFEKAKNISIFSIVMLLAFSAGVGFGLYENFVLSTDNLLRMVGTEAGNLYMSGDNLDEMGKEMEEWEEIDSILYYHYCTLKIESKEEETSVGCDIWKNPDLMHNEMLIEGRLPKYDNEIVLTASIAKRLQVDTGDTVYVTGQGERLSYVVCGIDQKIQNMGLKTLLNSEGAKRLNGSCPTSFIYIYTKGEIPFEEISEKIKSNFGEVDIHNSQKEIDDIMNGVTLAMSAICLLFVAITVFVVAMVEVLLIKSKMIRERQNLGLNKALGFTTGQLIRQTIMMNLPVITVGAAAGAIMSIFLMEPLIVGCLSFCGIKECILNINPVWILGTIVGIIIIAVITSFLSAVKIRKIEPVKMLTEE